MDRRYNIPNPVASPEKTQAAGCDPTDQKEEKSMKKFIAWTLLAAMMLSNLVGEGFPLTWLCTVTMYVAL